jgi:hypothetical protein
MTITNMTKIDPTSQTLPAETPAETIEPSRALSPEAQRALAEAKARRAAADAASSAPKEVGGREGPDPVRYGDWENGGIASDF